MESKIKVLWVDDQINSMSEFVLALQKNGFEVQFTDNSLEAIEIAKDIAFDIFLVDLKMPPPSGIETLEILQEIQPDAKFGVMSSFLYNEKYRIDLRKLKIPVELIEKDFHPVNSPVFFDRFVSPILSLAKFGPTKTIRKQDALLADPLKEDPFEIQLNVFLNKSILEKDRILSRAREIAHPIIDSAFAEGSIWILLCGSDREIRASATSLNGILIEEEIMKIAQKYNRAPFQFMSQLD